MSEVLVREYQPEDNGVLEVCTFELQEDEKSRQSHIWKDAGEIKSVYLEYAIKCAAESEGKVFVGEIGGKVAGYIVVLINEDKSPALLLKKYGYVMDLSVLREYHGQGVGKALMTKTEEYIRSKGLDWMQLNVTVGNPALNFYEKCGYTQKDFSLENKLSS